MDPLLIIVIVCILLWAGGFGVLGAGVPLIHLLLVIAIVVFLYKVFRGERL